MSLRCVNLGCSNRFIESWTNIDLYPCHKSIIKHDFTKGIPLRDEYADLVYHSHLIEHLHYNQGKQLLSECYRVLRNGGVIRIVCPDLENIISQYIEVLTSKNTDKLFFEKLRWVNIELFDQCTRDMPGGFFRDYVNNCSSDLLKKFILNRMGESVSSLLVGNDPAQELKKNFSLIDKIKSYLKLLENPQKIRSLIAYKLLNKSEQVALNVGTFRLIGETHKYMYDYYTLENMLQECGFSGITRRNEETSYFIDWGNNNLDLENENPFHANSLIIEGLK